MNTKEQNDQNATTTTTNVVDQKDQTEANDKKEIKKPKENYQIKFEEAARERDELRAKMQADEDARLAESNQYKTLYENERKRREEAELKEKKTKESFIHNVKMDAIKRAAIKEGIIDSALDDLEHFGTPVEIEFTSLGNVNVIGVEEYISDLKQKKSYMFKSTNPPKVNNGSSSAPTTFSSSELLDLEKKDPARYRQLLKEKLDKARTLGK